MIRAIVVDDEQPSIDRIKKLLCDSKMAAVVQSFTMPLAALEFLKENPVDAVFLDIEMPDMDGIELATRILDLHGWIDVVFVTAYNQYAVEAFQLNALDYLMKPVSADRLSKTLSRIARPKVPAQPSGLQVKCFGRFQVSAGDDEIRFRTEKAEELLAYLLTCDGRFVSRSKIIDSLWEDFEGDRAVVHFNTTLHNIKKALLAYGIRISIQFDRGAYRLDMDHICCDYLEFRTLDNTRTAITSDNVERFEKAAKLYQGEYLLGWEYGWVAAKRLVLESQYIRLLLALSDYYRKAGNGQGAVRWLEEGLLCEPLHRELNYRLVEGLILEEDRITAAKYYELYKNGLMKKFQTEPDTAFQRLLKQMR